MLARLLAAFVDSLGVIVEVVLGVGSLVGRSQGCFQFECFDGRYVELDSVEYCLEAYSAYRVVLEKCHENC